jgi:hypothetical protein
MNKRLFVIFFIASHVVFSNEFAFSHGGVDSNDWIYELLKSTFVPGHSVNVLENDGHLGTFYEKSLQEPRPKTGSYKELLVDELSRKKAQNSSLVAEFDRIKVEITKRSESLEKSKESLNESQSGRRGVDGYISSKMEQLSTQLKLDWDEFFKCVHQSLPILNLIVLGEKYPQNLSSVLDHEVRKVRLDKTRGGGDAIVRDGIVCGKFLGILGFVRNSYIDDVKFASVIASREKDEAKRLVVTAVAAFHTQSNREVSSIWKVYWQELSIRAVFTTEPLPLLEELEQKIVTLLVKQNEGTSLDVIRAHVSKISDLGIQLSRSLTK